MVCVIMGLRRSACEPCFSDTFKAGQLSPLVQRGLLPLIHDGAGRASMPTMSSLHDISFEMVCVLKFNGSNAVL